MKDLVLMGNSGAGKDLVAAHLVEYYGYTRVHPIGHLKAFLEVFHGLDEGSLDTIVGKANKLEQQCFIRNLIGFLRRNCSQPEFDLYPPYLGRLIENSRTIGDFMINMFHLSEKIGVNLSKPYVKKMCLTGGFKAFLAIRNQHEAELIKEHCNYEVIELIRPGVNGLSTDLHQSDIADYLGNKTQIINDGTIDELITKIDNFLF